MTNYRMVALLNVGPRAMWEWRQGDDLDVIETGFAFTADSTEEALEMFWTVGNKMGADANGRNWPWNRRSMCTGDLVTVVEEGSVESISIWACDSFGWKPLPEYLKSRAAINAEIEAELAADKAKLDAEAVCKWCLEPATAPRHDFTSRASAPHNFDPRVQA